MDAAPPDERASRIMRTAGALLSVQAITWASSLVSVAILPRFLGAQQFGFGATAWTAVALASLIAGFGTSNLVIKETARNPGDARQLVLHAIVVRSLIWTAICLAAALPVAMFTDSPTLLAVLAISTVSGWVGLILDAVLAGLQGLERLGRTSLYVGVLTLMSNAVTFVVLLLGGRIIAVTIASAAIGSLSALVGVATLLSVTGGSLTVQRDLVARMAAAGPPYLAWDLGQKVYASIDLMLLSFLASATSVGAYAFAYRIIGIPIFATTIVTMAVYPSLAASAASDAAWFRAVVSNAARLCFLVAAPMAVGIAILAPELVQLLSGGGFDRAEVLVVILALHLPPAALHTILGMALFATDRQRRMALFAWAAAAVNIAANLVLIPLADNLWDNGAIGAAIVTLTTEIGMGLLVWRWSWGFIDHAMVLGSIVKTIAACGVMAVVVLPVNAAAGIFVAIPAGAVTFGVASLALGAYSVGEIRQLAAQARPGAARELASVEA